MNSLEQFKHINAFAFDVDGVLTNGSLILLPNGIMARTMNVKDGYALQLAVKRGYKIAIISGGNSVEVIERLNLLGIYDVYMNTKNKTEALEHFLQKYNINKNEVLFMGDDVPDVEVMKQVGVPCCPNDAVVEVKQISNYISPFCGGQTCVRDVIEKVMKLQNNWLHEDNIVSK